MKDIEMALRELSEVQGTQINQLLDLVKQNKEINEGMRVRLHITPKVTIRIRFHLTIKF